MSRVAYADLDEEFISPTPVPSAKTSTPTGATDLGQGGAVEKPKPTESSPNSMLEIAPTPRTTKKPAGRSRKSSEKSQEPINFASQGAMAVKDPSVVELVKDVVLTQADMRMESDRVKAFMDQATNQPVKIVATGNVKLFKDDIDPTKRVRAVGNEAVFYNADRKVILRGNPKLWRGDDLIRGKEITYELDTGWVKVDRVEGVLVPKASPTVQKPAAE
jgi:lipopolysaccharide export system protein LptA